ncbi:MAG: riboflavin synthase [Candidatus Cloacimonadia bacterium]
MFTGIIRNLAQVERIFHKRNSLFLTIDRSNLNARLSAGDSVACNGVCLTVVDTEKSTFTVEVSKETKEKTNLALLAAGDELNIELPVTPETTFDGHLVQGHVDTTGKIASLRHEETELLMEILYPSQYKIYVVEKGSIAINGISLTIIKPSARTFSVNVISYTLENTNLKKARVGDIVNLEFDLIGKYIVNYLNNYTKEINLLKLLKE